MGNVSFVFKKLKKNSEMRAHSNEKERLEGSYKETKGLGKLHF